ncbi:glycosyltransferase [Shimia sp.]|uniref:glycosyltransferase n=1 Tax=Shimia sp. TaxID=1954381 RepID=UPI003B8BFA8F
MANVQLSVVVLTWNNLPLTRRFVDSIRQHTTLPYELIIVDNGSDSDSVDYGKDVADIFISNVRNEGFAVGMNQGMAAANGKFISFCNNDTVVPENWDKLLVQTASLPDVGIVFPALTAATNARTVRSLPGHECEHIAPFSAPPSGAFLVMLTEVARGIGGWGEEYAIASGEDVDLAFKVWVNDLQLVLDTRVLVDHVDKASSRNLDNQLELWRKNRQVFLEKWTGSPEVPRLESCSTSRHATNLATANSAAGWMSQYFRMREHADNLAAKGLPSKTSQAKTEKRKLIGASQPAQAKNADFAAEQLKGLWTGFEPIVDTDALRVTYFLPTLRVAGGVLGVMQLVSELRLLGVDASIVALGDKHEVYQWRNLQQPIIYKDDAHLRQELPETDVLIATHWSTAQTVHDLVQMGRARTSAYFLQDYEAWFFDEDDTANRQIVRDTYDLIPHKIVKSDWLSALLEQDGHQTHKIPLGVDLDFFYPRTVEKSDPPTVIAMGRPRTPRRGFATLTKAFEIVHKEYPEAEFILFGEDISSMALPFPFRCEGLLTDQERLARLYSSATVHLDASDFQAFGRPALEAMACGTANVLTDVGGVGEYARSGENCILVPAREPEKTANAILELLNNTQLRNSLIQDGLQTALGYSMHREARDTLALFRRILNDAEE